jgi:LysR family glycine cleavage system transcriptional activator
LSTDVYLQEFNATQADVMIFYGLGGFTGLHAELLMQEAISPVCAPEVAKTLRSINDLERHTILRDALQNVGSPPSWEFWAEEAGLTLPQLPLGRQFGQANMVIQAAIQGLGVAMGRGPLVADAIAQGLLVCPFEDVVASQFSYWLVCRHDALKSRKVRLFCEWLHEQTSAQNANAVWGLTVPPQ